MSGKGTGTGATVLEMLGETPDWVSTMTADACRLPPGLRTGHDLVFSNAVIEHVGGHLRRATFAEAVDGLADRHWVQTRYRYFRVETALLFPGFQFLSLSTRARVLRHWPLVHTRPHDRQGALTAALDVELLSRTEMRYLFPRSQIVTERVFGCPELLMPSAVERPLATSTSAEPPRSLNRLMTDRSAV